jgi:molybdate transport system ATP-binding protein
MFFEVDVARRLGDFDLAAHFETGAGLTALTGPSGVGKTSLLNMIAGTLRPDRGRIVVAGCVLFDSDAGIDIAPERRRAGYIFQDGRLFPHLRVRANLLYGWNLARPEHHWISFDEVIGFLGIGDLLTRWPESLSGGERQRVAIGRALLSGPAFLLMDEPLAALDTARKAEILPVIRRIRDELALPLLYVTHDEREVASLATTHVVLT